MYNNKKSRPKSLQTGIDATEMSVCKNPLMYKKTRKKPDVFIHRDQGPTKNLRFPCEQTPGKTCRIQFYRYISPVGKRVNNDFNLVGFGLVHREICQRQIASLKILNSYEFRGILFTRLNSINIIYRIISSFANMFMQQSEITTP